MRDQTKRVYKMEVTFMDAGMSGHVKRKDLQKLADQACIRWKVPKVKVVFSEDNYWYGEYFSETRKIKLYDAPVRVRKGHGRNKLVLLHEVAHHIEDVLRPDDTESHSPAFTYICMDLFDHFNVIPGYAYKEVAKRHRVKIAAPRRNRRKKKKG